VVAVLTTAALEVHPAPAEEEEVAAWERAAKERMAEMDRSQAVAEVEEARREVQTQQAAPVRAGGSS